MSERTFADTNIVVYATMDDAKTDDARTALRSVQVLGLQVLNEFAHVARRRFNRSPAEIGKVTDGFIATFEIWPSSVDLHRTALELCLRYRYGFFDSLLIATALDAGCTRLYSEDLQHNQLIDKRLRIVNPFR